MDTRESVLAAASTLFARRGFDGASTREIADRAGANQALIRYHFGGKDPLWREVVARGLAQLAGRLSPGSTSMPAGADADRVGALLDALHAHPETVQVIAHALLDPGARRDWLMREHLAPLQARAAGWLGSSAAAQPAFLSMWIGAAIAPSVFAPALAAADRAPEPSGVRGAQHALLAAWLRGEPLAVSGGPWSLAAARLRAAAGSV